MQSPFHRLRRLAPFVVFYVVAEFALRVALLARSIPELPLTAGLAVRVVLTGFLFDAVVGLHLLLVPGVYLLLATKRWLQRASHRTIAFAASAVGVFVVTFAAAAEWIFWQEFESRFNFIAVDYLVYTREVIENIVESYPVLPLLGAILVASLGMAWVLRRFAPAGESATGLPARLVGLALLAAGPVLAFDLVDASLARLSNERLANELALNGMYSLLSAFRTNQIDYDQFYLTREPEEALASARTLLAQPGATFRSAHPEDLARRIVTTGDESRPNVILIVVESLSAEYLGVFGGTKGLTPNLDRIAEESMLFTRIYATGNRTVRGIEAITLSVPPTPGSSMVKRPNNANLFSLGFLFRERGYETRFLYGGYGYFDNMNAFFGANGFDVIDRSDLSSQEISFSNAWGVADGDLFRKTLEQADADAARGESFLYFALTTSNHRPFTFPQGRIDIPSGSGRAGGVKYTDWAIGQFLEAARSRPWFADTIFVIVADHCAGTSGRVDLEIEHYHIPLLVYAPGRIAPRRIDTLASQMDLAPTLLGLLGWDYTSKFFGRDILVMRPEDGRALPATYERLGYWRGGTLVALGPKREVAWVRLGRDGRSRPAPRPLDDDELLSGAIGFYESASYAHAHGLDHWEGNVTPLERLPR